MRIVNTTAIALISCSLIGLVSTPARSATVKDQMMTAENMARKDGAPTSVDVQSSAGHARTALVTRRDQSNCRPSHLYSDGIVGDPDS